MLDRFDGVQAQVLGLSVDSVPCLKAWADNLGGISYPLLSDFYPHGKVSQAYGVLRSEGYSERAIFVIDKIGIVRYVDVHDIDDQPDNDELLRVLAELEPRTVFNMPTVPRQPSPASTPAAAPVERPATGPAAAHRVTLYCTSWCPGCFRARDFLKKRGIPYTEIDITKDRDAAQRVRAWAGGNETTPTLEIDGQVIVDYKEMELKKIFGR
jgi:glutaredoxin